MKKKLPDSSRLRKVVCSQFFLAMRLSLALCFFVVLSASANVNVLSQNVNLDFENANLREVFRSLREQTGHVITYSLDKVEVENTRVSIQRRNVPLAKALDEILKGLPYTYTIEDDEVLIIPAPERQAPRWVTISGRVTDTAGHPLAGVTVLVRGTNIGATSDVNGQYTLTTQSRDGMVLRYSFIGKKDIEVPFTGQSQLNVTLEDSVSEIDQVVVTGYQTISREKVTGAVVTVTDDELSARYSPNIMDNLEGKVAGLVYYDGKVTIRGAGSIHGERSPLLVIDGLPTEGKIEDLNPYDIQSVTVLKDAAATAIYGARGSNGIIIVTTKNAPLDGLYDSGKKITVDVSANITIYEKRNLDYADNFYMTPAQQVDFDSDYYKYYFSPEYPATNQITSTENGIAQGWVIGPIQYMYYQLAKGDIDQDEVDKCLGRLRQNNFAKEYAEHALRNRVLQQYNVAVRSRSESFQSNLVLNYKHDNSGIKSARDNQFNLFYKGSYDMTDWLTINFGVNGILSKSVASNSSVATNPFNVPAYFSMFEDDGSYSSYVPSGGMWNDYNTLIEANPGLLRSMHFNHLQELDRDTKTTNRHNLRYQGELLFKIIRGLTVNTQFIYETEKLNESSYSEAESYLMRMMRNIYTVPNGNSYKYMIPENGGKRADRTVQSDFWTARGQLNFNRRFNRHMVDFLAGIEFRQTRQWGTRSLLLGYDDQLQIDQTSVVDFYALSKFEKTAFFTVGYNPQSLFYEPYIESAMGPVPDERHRFASAYANVTYTYDSKYNLFGSYLKDFADILGLEHRYRGRPFWSIGASWNIHNEAFMDGAQWIDYLKLRVSYGVTGNIYDGATSYMTATAEGFNEYTGLPYGRVRTPQNRELTWEKTTTTNIGLDFNMFGNRLRSSLDWYHKKGEDIFASQSIDPSKGFSYAILNMADMKNDGVELTLAYDWFRARSRNEFSWMTSLTASYNRNKITKVELTNTSSLGVISLGYKVGYPVSSLFSYRFAGIDAAGRPTWYDQNGEAGLNISSSIDALAFCGQSEPKTALAMENHFSFRGFSLSVMMVYYGGHKMRVRQPQEHWNPSYGPSPAYLLDSWTLDNTDTNVPGFGQWGPTSSTSPYNLTYSDIFVQPADFIKIRNIVVGYDLPHKLLSRLGMNNVSLRFQIDNPHPLWKKNDVDIDPETYSIRRPTSYIFGINFTF